MRVEFLRDEYGFTVRFYRHCGKGWSSDSRSFHAVVEKGHEKGREKGRETKSSVIEKRMESILALLRKNSDKSIKKMAAELNLSEKQVRTAIDRLKSEGIIHYEGPGKGGRWVID